jgi:hypothetical protein
MVFAAGETGFRDQVAPQHFLPAHVCFGSKADVVLLNFDVCFTPESGHPMRQLECPLRADFVAEVGCKLFWSVIPSL